jgi:hypothetical protein
MPMTFSQFLLRNEYASLAEIEEASQAAVLFGGRLGTALIELGVLTPEQLDSALARHHGLPEIPKEWLAHPDAGARAALHLDLMKRHRAFPLSFEKRTLHVGMVDPRDQEVLDDLAFASGCVIVPYALAEFRFALLMQRVYGIAPSTRFKNLLVEGARARAMRGRERRQEQLDAKREKAAEAFELGPLAADIELSDGESFFAAATEVPRPQSAKPSPSAASAGEAGAGASPEIDGEPPDHGTSVPPASLESLERILAESTDRAEVIEASAALAARFAEIVALFVIRDEVAAGLAGRRAGQPLDIESTLIPLAPHSALAACIAAKQPVRVLPRKKLDQLLAKALRGGEQSELAVFPVAIGERVVNLLVAQPAVGALGVTAEAALRALAPQIGAAYERLIRVQKQQAQAAPAPESAKKAAIGALSLERRLVRVRR